MKSLESKRRIARARGADLGEGAAGVAWRSVQDEAVAGLDGGSVRGFIWPQSACGAGRHDLPGNSNER